MLNQTASTSRQAQSDGSRFARPAEEIVERYGSLEVADHPLFAWLNARPVDLSALWLLMANLRTGVSHDFIVWLATTIARVEDRRIGSLLAKQLDDELGHGVFDEIHSVLLDRFVGALEPWRRSDGQEALLAPGRRLAEEINKVFAREDAYEGVGALIVGEIFAEKMDHCLGDQIRRQDVLDAEALIWLTIHERLEADHAGDSNTLAMLVPREGAQLAATWRGASAQWQLLWELLDGVYALARQPSA